MSGATIMNLSSLPNIQISYIHKSDALDVSKKGRQIFNFLASDRNAPVYLSSRAVLDWMQDKYGLEIFVHNELRRIICKPILMGQNIRYELKTRPYTDD